MERMQPIHRVVSGTKPARALASGAAVLVLGLSLVLGACGQHNQNTDNGNGANAPTTSQTGTGYQGAVNNVQDLQNLDASLNDEFTNLDLDSASMNQDLSSMDQAVQP